MEGELARLPWRHPYEAYPLKLRDARLCVIEKASLCNRDDRFVVPSRIAHVLFVEVEVEIWEAKLNQDTQLGKRS